MESSGRHIFALFLADVMNDNTLRIMADKLRKTGCF